MSTIFDTATKRASAPPEAGIPGFSEKYQEYFPRVFAFIYSRVGQTHLAEDLAADVFERAYRNQYDRFVPSATWCLPRTSVTSSAT